MAIVVPTASSLGGWNTVSSLLNFLYFIIISTISIPAIGIILLFTCVLLSTPGVVDGLRGIYYFLFAHFFGVVDGLRGIRLFLFARSFLQVVNSINAVIIIVYNSIMTVGIVISINIWCTTPSLEVVMIVLLNIS